jgi:hypothetical protein
MSTIERSPQYPDAREKHRGGGSCELSSTENHGCVSDRQARARYEGPAAGGAGVYKLACRRCRLWTFRIGGALI